jgi:hypothetical protein
MSHTRPRDPQLEQFWRRAIARWKNSGQSIRAFCAAYQLSEASFHGWRRELAKRDQANLPAVSFVPLQLRTEALLEVALPNGLIVRASAAVAPEAVVALVEALRSESC